MYVAQIQFGSSAHNTQYLERCWQEDIQDIWASLVGRLVKDSNTDFRKAIRSMSQGEAVPLQHHTRSSYEQSSIKYGKLLQLDKLASLF